MAKILLAEDSLTEAEYIKQLLAPLGHEVVLAMDGEDAEKMAIMERPDLLILDIVMPKRNGFQVTRTIRQKPECRHMPIIVVSSLDHDSDRVWGLRQGANEYLFKPFEPEQLLSAVRRFIPTP